MLQVPGGHQVHSKALEALYNPGAHCTQVALDVAPMLTLYVPAAQAVQAAMEVDAVLVL